MTSLLKTVCLPLLFLSLLVPPVFAQQTITLNTSNDPPNATDDFQGIGDLVLTEAFKRMGMQLKIMRLPSERALQNANDANDDGTFAQVAGLSKMYPNLIQVPEPITRFEFIAISRKYNVPIIGWKSLAPFNVGFITGWKILEENITGSKSLTKVKDKTVLFDMLMAERLDLIVYDRRQAMAVLQDMRTAETINFMEPSLAVHDMYPYLHKKHENLALPLAETIRTMKADGAYRKILARILLPLSITGDHEKN